MTASSTVENLPITRDAETLGGLPVFAGTRVLVRTLWEYLEAGQSLSEFLDDFPTVSEAKAKQVIAYVRATFPDIAK